MAKHGRLVRIFFNQFRLSQYLRSADLTGEAAPLDATVFESTAKEFVLDTEDGQFSAEGFYRGTEEDADEILREALGSDTKANLLVTPEGWAAVGKRALMMSCDAVGHAVKKVATGLIMITTNFQSSSGLNAGVVLHPYESETATGNETSHDNGAATTNGAVAQIHLDVATEVGDETLNSVVQHSVDNAVWVDLISFAQLDAVGTERKSVTGTVNRYTRERHAVAGSAPSFKYAVALSRLKPSQV